MQPHPFEWGSGRLSLCLRERALLFTADWELAIGSESASAGGRTGGRADGWAGAHLSHLPLDLPLAPIEKVVLLLRGGGGGGGYHTYVSQLQVVLQTRQYSPRSRGRSRGVSPPTHTHTL